MVVIGAVHPSRLASLLPSLMPYLKRMHQEMDAPAPSQIVEGLKESRYTLHVYGEEGFFVAGWYGRALHVVVAAAFDGHCVTPLEDIFEAVKTYAKGCGCESLTFTSPRAAWARIAPRVMAEVTSVNYKVDL